MARFRKAISLALAIVLSFAQFVTVNNAIPFTLVEDIFAVFEKFGFRKVSA